MQEMTFDKPAGELLELADEIEAWLWNDDRFAKPPEAALFVRVDNFNASSIDYLIYAFTHTKNWGEWLAIKEEFAIAVMEIIEKAGTSFAFPSQTAYLTRDEGIDTDARARVEREIEERRAGIAAAAEEAAGSMPQTG